MKTLVTGAALFGVASFSSRSFAAPGPAGSTSDIVTPPIPTAPTNAPLAFDLPPLPYAFNALEPHIDAKTMEIHYAKHHAAYVANARKLLEPHPELLALGANGLVADLSRVPESIRAGVRNNAGGHVNHTFFWTILTPTATPPEGPLVDAITKKFSSMEAFKKQFNEAATKRFGSGWAWLSVDRGGDLVVHSTANQDSPLSEGMRPVIGLDVWEHAYYLKHQNRRPEYIEAFWQVLNWPQASANFSGSTA